MTSTTNTNICKKCGTSTRYAEDLRQHMESWHSKTGFDCRSCDQHFKLEYDRDVHQKHKHEGMEIYQDELNNNPKDVFDKDISTVDDMSEKVQTKCTICRKEVEKVYFERHVKDAHIDTIFEPSEEALENQCELCQKVFLTSKEVEDHASKEHIENVFAITDVETIAPKKFDCKFCLEKLDSALYLQLHVDKIHHDEQSIGSIKEPEENHGDDEFSDESSDEENVDYDHLRTLSTESERSPFLDQQKEVTNQTLSPSLLANEFSDESDDEEVEPNPKKRHRESPQKSNVSFRNDKDNNTFSDESDDESPSEAKRIKQEVVDVQNVAGTAPTVNASKLLNRMSVNNSDNEIMKKYKCGFCAFECTSSDAEDFQFHMDNKHTYRFQVSESQKPQTFQCHICDKNYYFSSHLQVHLKMFHNSVKTEAKVVANDVKVSPNDIKKFKPDEEPKIKSKCNECFYFSYNEETIILHLRAKHKQNVTKDSLSLYVTFIANQKTNLNKKKVVSHQK